MVPLGIDKERLMIQLGRLQEHVAEIEKVKEAVAAKEAGDILVSAAERFLQLAIEDCLNIGSHIISAKGLRRADTYKEVFIILREDGVISQALSDAMQKLAVFRNRLVHLYWKVTADEVVEKLNESDIFRKYAKEALDFLNKELEKNQG